MGSTTHTQNRQNPAQIIQNQGGYDTNTVEKFVYIPQ